MKAASRRAEATTPLIVPPTDHGSRTPSARKYVNRITEVAKTAVLPIEQPTTFEFVANIKTAMAIGIVLPPALLARLDEAIE